MYLNYRPMCTKNKLLLLLLLLKNSIGQAQYECGSHGRFEYCIDGIPGCVIGCHCHPGYYFDTDSKICEPNLKLTQGLRRQYLSEPTRVQIPALTEKVITEPTPTTQRNALDQKVDEITKDADDLGDWLYNQFFKTIENQIINNTKGNDLPNRRTGRGNAIKKPKRKTRKSWRSKKNKKIKGKGLRKKMLRITEDDSLFESDSGTSSSEDDSTSESDSRSSGSSSSRERGSSSSREPHSHKKIVFFNKNPKPPLPSFIFMPNIDTPYYPPIGLPPPALPMYPMAPVPPVGSMPCPGIPMFCEINNKTENPTTAPPSTTTPSITKLSKQAKEDSKPNDAKEKKDKNETNKDKASKETGNKKENKKAIRSRTRNRVRDKFLQKLRAKMKKSHKKTDWFSSEVPLINEDLSQEPLDLNNPHEIPMQKIPSKLGDVDLKYLTQLIHRTNLNNTNKLPPIVITKINTENTDKTRRIYNNNIVDSNDRLPIYSNNEREQNDSYYMNLGRQIASLIRNIDTNGDRQINVEVEQVKQQNPSQSVFFENRYSPRSYWERSIRSPINRNDLPIYELVMNNNENLFNLENKVEVAASTITPLNLEEIENIIKAITLVPKGKKGDGVDSKAYSTFFSKYVNSNMVPVKSEMKQKKLTYAERKPETTYKYDQIKLTTVPYTFNLIDNIHKHAPTFHTNVYNLYETNNGIDKKKKFPLESYLVPLFNRHIELSSRPHHLSKNIISSHINNKQIMNTPQSKYNAKMSTNNFKYFPKKEDQFVLEKTSFTIQDPNKAKQQKWKQSKEPSYFHHEFHHFDYFDTD